MSRPQKSFHCHITPRSSALAEVLQATKASRCISFFVVTALEAYLATEEGRQFARPYLKSSGTVEHTAENSPEGAGAEKTAASRRRFDLDSVL